MKMRHGSGCTLSAYPLCEQNSLTDAAACSVLRCQDSAQRQRLATLIFATVAVVMYCEHLSPLGPLSPTYCHVLSTPVPCHLYLVC